MEDGVADVIADVPSLLAAVGDPHAKKIVLAPGTYRLWEPLHIRRDVVLSSSTSATTTSSLSEVGDGTDTHEPPPPPTIDDFAAGSDGTVVLVGRLVMAAGTLRGIDVRPAPDDRRQSAPAPVVDIPSGSTAVICDCDITVAAALCAARPPSSWAHAARPPSQRVQRPLSTSAAASAAARPASRTGVAFAASCVPLPEMSAVALRIGSYCGAAVRVLRCRLSAGNVSIGEGASPSIVTNKLLDGGGFELQGTSSECELRGNRVCESRGCGMVLSMGASGQLSRNVLIRCGGSAGIELSSASCAVLSSNLVVDARSVGILIRGGACGELRGNTVRSSRSSALEISGVGTKPTVCNNTLLDSESGVGVLILDRAAPTLEGNQVSGHPLAGIEVGRGASPSICGCTVRSCGQTGVLLAHGARGTLKSNRVEANAGNGIECCSDERGLLVEGNVVCGHKRGAGLLARALGTDQIWLGNAVTANKIGVEVEATASPVGPGREGTVVGAAAADAALPTLQTTRVHGNLHTGVRVRSGVRIRLAGCQIRANGAAFLVRSPRRGERTHGDESGAGVVVHDGAAVILEGTQLSGNMGPGLFAHANAHVDVLKGNVFRNNRGDAMRTRPSTTTSLSAAGARAVTPTVVRRQRVPFDWTVGDNVSADDKTLAERAEEMKAQYYAMSGDKTACSLAMLPDGMEPSMACVVS